MIDSSASNVVAVMVISSARVMVRVTVTVISTVHFKKSRMDTCFFRHALAVIWPGAL